MAKRRDFHFVFGLREQTEPFHLLHWLSIASCLAVNRPDAIHFHFRNEPFGVWWDRIKPMLTLHRIPERIVGFSPEHYRNSDEGRLIERLDLSYAHQTDFLRLDILIEHGGVYADIDTLFAQRYPDDWFDSEFAIGEENASLASNQNATIRPSLCNAVLFAHPRARFANAWRENMSLVFDGTWNRHSCDEPARLWRTMPDAVRVLPAVYFYRYGGSIAGLRTLLEESDRAHSDLYSVHLWAHLWWAETRKDFSHVHAGEIDEAWIRSRDCTLANLARRFLP
jgi:Glycosyltransferase sugar-binding region containing DXD motif